ncbi:STAS domain-containing protein [Nakamurella endophytica]|uniref:Anti-sigma factor antagonist n=1 Tax=Nakamurella endophytica TaxID=1748367 RepID=A0A917WJX4_9ACTN|nr:STAS domain-containing protein [Nakamurella endophytica]GGM08974.1 anti-sigma factor antagonist [Nakamurella endophytica]
MRIRIDTSGSRASVAVAGRFDAHEVAEFRTVVEPLVAAADELRLDLSNVVFIDSTALAELVRLDKATRAAGGTLVLTDLSDPVRVIMEITALLPVFTVEEPAGAGADGAP